MRLIYKKFTKFPMVNLSLLRMKKSGEFDVENKETLAEMAISIFGLKAPFHFFISSFGGRVSLLPNWNSNGGQYHHGRSPKKVRHDLDLAWLIYEEKLRRIRDILDLIAKRDLIIRCLKEGQVEVLRRELERIRLDYQLDILTITDQKGIALPRTRSPY